MLAAKHVWIILSAFFLLLMLSLCLAPADLLYKASSMASMPHDEPCLFCGMTRSFVHMAEGDLSRALSENTLGPVFFFLISINEVYFLGYLFGKGLHFPKSLQRINGAGLK